MKIYPIGYGNHGPLVEQLMNSDPTILLMDTRLSPRCSWSADWTRPALYAKYKDRYHFAGSLLGNKNYHNDNAIELVDSARGIHGLQTYLKEGHDLILLCQCREYEECHRKVIVDLLLQKMPEVEVIDPDTIRPEDTIPCLSIQQPWAWLILNGYKDVENRQWSTKYRGPLLIHAGGKVDSEWFERGGKLNTYLASRFGMEKVMPRQKEEYTTGAILGMVDLGEVVDESASPWFFGKYGFQFNNPRKFEPVPYRGQLKLFPVPFSDVPELAQVKA